MSHGFAIFGGLCAFALFILVLAWFQERIDRTVIPRWKRKQLARWNR